MSARIVALGGGHGLYASLTALRDLTEELTAIVTVADDGGSSGRLRDELGIVPPGDLRMALSALCEDTEWGRTWRDVLQARFATQGPLDGHAMGNLLIAALWSHTGDVVEGLAWVGKLLRAHGRVLPLADEPLQIAATVDDGVETKQVHGQVGVATARGVVTSLEISPARPSVPAATLAAIDEADLIVLGPGSWYTSVLTHFLVPDVAKRLVNGGRKTVLVLNIAHLDNETAGMDRADDIAALRQLAPDFVPAVVLADAGYAADQRLADAVAQWGSRLVCADLVAEGTADRHDTAALGNELNVILPTLM